MTPGLGPEVVQTMLRNAEGYQKRLVDHDYCPSLHEVIEVLTAPLMSHAAAAERAAIRGGGNCRMPMGAVRPEQREQGALREAVLGALREVAGDVYLPESARSMANGMLAFVDRVVSWRGLTFPWGDDSSAFWYNNVGHAAQAGTRTLAMRPASLLKSFLAKSVVR
jgi:hypothetical protein